MLLDSEPDVDGIVQMIISEWPGLIFSVVYASSGDISHHLSVASEQLTVPERVAEGLWVLRTVMDENVKLNDEE